MILNDTAKLEFSTDDGTDVEFTAYAVNDSGSAVTPVFNSGASNSTTAVDLIAAPAASNVRLVKRVRLRNAGSTARVVTVRVDVSGTDREEEIVTLYPGDCLTYDGALWRRTNANAYLMEGIYALRSSVGMASHFASANLTATKTITSNSTFAVYIGKAPRTYISGDTLQVRNRVTTGMATITWGEVAIAKGNVNVAGNPTLTVVGYADVSGSFNGTGQKTTSVTLSAGQTIKEGDDVWVLIGNSATTACVVRAQSIADDIQVGLQASLATRPSLNVGNGQVYTIESATALAAWVALIW